MRPAGVRPADNTDEGGLWNAMDKAEVQARASADVNRDPQLNAYVREIFCKLSVQYCNEIRIYVMDRPYFNAAMAPNGYMEVWSGALLRAETEDEVAFVLGHELAHYGENHSINAWRNMKSRANMLMGVQIGLSLVGAAAAGNASSVESARAVLDAADVVSNVVYLATIASLFGFSREQETEADRRGLELAAEAGYAVDTGVAHVARAPGRGQGLPVPQGPQQRRAHQHLRQPSGDSRTHQADGQPGDGPAGDRPLRSARLPGHDPPSPRQLDS
jgi:Zn-dependent protease with chaperone function